MLAETAIGDSRDYEILSLEEVEELKKEYTFLSGRIDGAKRKLALEMKLRDAAKSLSKLYGPKSARASEEYDPSGSPKSRRSRRSLFGRSGTAETLDKSDEELAVSTRKCEALAQELWQLENRAQNVHKRLLEHTAGVLQITHKGLKKNAKGNVPQSPQSMNGSHTRDSIDDFDDRSLYQSSEYLDGFNGYGRGAGHGNGSGSMSVGLDAIQDTERKLEDLSTQVRNTILRSNPDYYLDPVPQAASNGGPVNPTATVEAHVAYIANGLGMLGSHSGGSPRAPELGAPELGDESEGYLRDVNDRMYRIVAESGLSRGPTLPPPPKSGSGTQEHLSYLTTGVDSLQNRLEGLVEQKGILTTQIQQQRELNSKSDAERDAHIADLTEQLANARKEFQLSEREGQSTRDNLDLVYQQLETARQEVAHSEPRESSRDDDDSAALAQEKETREKAEAEVARIGIALQQLQNESGSKSEVHEARMRAENEVARLESELEQLRSKFHSQAEELTAVRSQTDGEIVRLQGVVDILQHESDARAEEVVEARDRAEQQVSQMEEAMQQIRNESDSRVREATDSHAQARSEVARLEAVIAELRNDVDPQVKDATDARVRAEQQVAELEEAIQQLRNESDGRVREATDSHAQAQSEVARLEAAIGQLRNEEDPRLKQATNARTEAEETSARLEKEFMELESSYVRAQTELTMAKAELDSVYGNKSQRAAADPALQNKFDALYTRNVELAEELAALKARRPVDGNIQRRVETLEKELRETIDDYEAMTKASIEFEKEREGFEGVIDRLRDRCEQLETQINEERISWMGLHSPTSVGRDPSSETTSTMVLKNEFKRMMRDTRIENMKILKVSLPPRGLFHVAKLTFNEVGTRRASTTGKPAPFSEEGADPWQWQAESQPASPCYCYGFMITTAPLIFDLQAFLLLSALLLLIWYLRHQWSLISHSPYIVWPDYLHARFVDNLPYSCSYICLFGFECTDRILEGYGCTIIWFIFFFYLYLSYCLPQSNACLGKCHGPAALLLSTTNLISRSRLFFFFSFNLSIRASCFVSSRVYCFFLSLSFLFMLRLTLLVRSQAPPGRQGPS